MSKTAYNISLKGYVGGSDFDRKTVDSVLASNEGKAVSVLIDSLGGSLATGLSIFSEYDELITFCKAIHADEDGPELMAQDHEGFPASDTTRDSCTKMTSTKSSNCEAIAEYQLNKPI